MPLQEDLIKQQEKLRQLQEKKFAEKVADIFKPYLGSTVDRFTEIYNGLLTYLKDHSDKLDEIKQGVKGINNNDVKEHLASLEETIKKKDFTGKQGVKGDKGEKGDKGDPGKTGRNGIDGKDGIDGVDGKAGERGSDGQNGADGRDGSPDSPKDIKDKLEGLRGNDRLDASAIKNLHKYFTTVYDNSLRGLSTFLGLSDAPSSYAGQAGKLVTVNDAEDALEFASPAPAGVTSVTGDRGVIVDPTTGEVGVSFDLDYTGGPYTRKDQNLADLSDWAAAISELKLDSTINGQGASLVGVEDAAGKYSAENVEGVLTELYDNITTVAGSIITDHGDLTGLSDDDHAQYHNDTRGDVRYLRRANNSTKDQGYEQSSSVDGITADYISDKTLHNVAIKGHPATKQTGSVWFDTTVTPNVLHAYHDSAEKTIMTDFTMVNNRLQHHPRAYDIDTASGNSDQLGCNGFPLVQGYGVSQGAYPVPILIDGGTF